MRYFIKKQRSGGKWVLNVQQGKSLSDITTQPNEGFVNVKTAERWIKNMGLTPENTVRRKDFLGRDDIV